MKKEKVFFSFSEELELVSRIEAEMCKNNCLQEKNSHSQLQVTCSRK